MRKIALIAALIAGMATTLFSVSAVAAAERAALRAVEGYMSALIIGDTHNMGSRMGTSMQTDSYSRSISDIIFWF